VRKSLNEGVEMVIVTCLCNSALQIYEDPVRRITILFIRHPVFMLFCSLLRLSKDSLKRIAVARRQSIARNTLLPMAAEDHFSCKSGLNGDITSCRQCLCKYLLTGSTLPSGTRYARFARRKIIRQFAR